MSLAIIDATAGDAGPALSARYSSRYATPIANAPLIGHVLDELMAAGIKRARIVTNPRVRPDLDQALRAGTTRGIDVSYRDAPEGEERIALLSEVERALSAEPVLMHPGDGLFGAQIMAMQQRFRDGDVDSVLPARSSSEPLPSPAQRRATDSALLLGPATRPLLAELTSEASPENDLIDSLRHSGCRLAVCEQGVRWRYSPATEALLAANRMILDQLPETVEAEPGVDNQLHGRISISPTASISNCILYGPISIADRAVLEDSFVGPYTAVGAGAILSGAEIDNSMVLAGSEVRSPGFRIEGSVIGERARVLRSFELPKGLHLRLGPGSRATFS